MLREILKTAGRWIHETGLSISTKITVLIRYPGPCTFERKLAQLCSMASMTGCRSHEGPERRLINSHAPVFSLFTFFADSQ